MRNHKFEFGAEEAEAITWSNTVFAPSSSGIVQFEQDNIIMNSSSDHSQSALDVLNLYLPLQEGGEEGNEDAPPLLGSPSFVLKFPSRRNVQRQRRALLRKRVLARSLSAEVDHVPSYSRSLVANGHACQQEGSDSSKVLYVRKSENESNHNGLNRSSHHSLSLSNHMSRLSLKEEDFHTPNLSGHRKGVTSTPHFPCLLSDATNDGMGVSEVKIEAVSLDKSGNGADPEEALNLLNKIALDDFGVDQNEGNEAKGKKVPNIMIRRRSRDALQECNRFIL